MLCLNCFKSSVAMDKEKCVRFNNSVKVLYFKPTPIDSNINWQQVARDRHRFTRRIRDVEKKIGWVFDSQHRLRIYEMLLLINMCL